MTLHTLRTYGPDVVCNLTHTRPFFHQRTYSVRLRCHTLAYHPLQSAIQLHAKCSQPARNMRQPSCHMPPFQRSISAWVPTWCPTWSISAWVLTWCPTWSISAWVPEWCPTWSIRIGPHRWPCSAGFGLTGVSADQ